MTDEIKKDVQEIVGNVTRYTLQAFEGREILITGGSGFLGSWFVAVFDYLNTHVFTRPCTVYVMDSGIACDKNNALYQVDSKHIFFRKDDISTHVLEGSVDYIIHAAGLASPIYYRRYPIETIDGMVLGLSNLLKFAVKNPIRSMLYFSSSEMYGNPDPESVPTPETYNGNVSCTGPRSCYDESKRMGETMCVAYHKIHGVPVKWVRPFNVYGPGMRRTDDRVVPKFMYQMLTGEPVTVHIPGNQTRTFCYITDAMIGFFKALLEGEDGEVYNIGNNDPEISVNELALRIKDAHAPNAQIQEVEMPPEYPRDQAARRCPDITKAWTVFNYSPSVSLPEGLKRMWSWCETQL